jgi:hypothetical protein
MQPEKMKRKIARSTPGKLCTTAHQDKRISVCALHTVIGKPASNVSEKMLRGIG